MDHKIYLDTCSLQRPLDTRSQIRIALEAEAVLGLIGLLELGRMQLIASEVLKFEVSKNPKQDRRQFAMAVLSKATIYVPLDDAVETRAELFVQHGLKPLDALHLASAEMGKADYFCTADDGILKKTRRISLINTTVVSPIQLIQEIEK
jgi:predicted nucleic acid-binding protein